MTDEPEQADRNELLEAYKTSKVMENLNKPNTQFIQHATQLNKRARELFEYFQRFKEALKLKNISSASLRTGSGFLINNDNLALAENVLDNIIEVIDYDPVRNNMMVIGKYPPAMGATLHWFIYRGLPEINGIIILEDKDILEKFRSGSFSELVYNDGIINVDLALRILRSVKNSNVTLLFGSIINGIIITGNTMDDAFELLEINLKKYPK